MVKVTWTEQTAVYEERWVDVPDSDIEQLLKDNPDYDKDDIKDWLERNMYDYDIHYGDTDYDDANSESIRIEADADNELDDIIEDFKENYKDEEEEEETDNTFIGTLGYDED